MDTKNEDTIVRQIEKNLSNNINENLFLTGRVFETSKAPVKKNIQNVGEEASNNNTADPDYPLVSYEHITNSNAISRAEYIRQAREACLRQLSNTQVYSRAYDVDYMEPDTASSEQQNTKKTRAMGLFHNSSQKEGMAASESTPQELAAFRFLIIRTVCAVLIFLSIFIIDKFELKIGTLTHTMIEEYVTGNDTLQELENIMLTWLK